MSGPLAGKRVVNTRAAQQAGELDHLLREAGALTLAYPCIAMAPPRDLRSFEASVAELRAGRFDWLVLTSANTVRALAQVVGRNLDSTRFRCATVGPATAACAERELGIPVDVVPPVYDAEALAAALPVEKGARALLPQSEIARPALAQRLRGRGVDVTVVTAYCTISGSGGDDIPDWLGQGRVDALTFTSSSTVTFFLERLAREGGDAMRALNTVAACIGGRSAKTARACGFSELIVAREHTLPAMVAALETYFEMTENPVHDS